MTAQSKIIISCARTHLLGASSERPSSAKLVFPSAIILPVLIDVSFPDGSYQPPMNGQGRAVIWVENCWLSA